MLPLSRPSSGIHSLAFVVVSRFQCQLQRLSAIRAHLELRAGPGCSRKSAVTGRKYPAKILLFLSSKTLKYNSQLNFPSVYLIGLLHYLWCRPSIKAETKPLILICFWLLLVLFSVDFWPFQAIITPSHRHTHSTSKSFSLIERLPLVLVLVRKPSSTRARPGRAHTIRPAIQLRVLGVLAF